MNYQILILGISIHFLFYEHLPHWGGWFNKALSVLPKPLQGLYEQWRCPYCAGFWIGLSLHAVTGQWFMASFAELPAYWGGAGLALGWFLDGLAFALLNKFGVLIVHAVGLPALLGYAKKQEFFAKTADAEVSDETATQSA